MTTPAVTAPDVERLVVDHLTTVCAGHLPAGTTIGIGVPANWTPGSAMRVQVAWDGTPNMTWPIVIRATIRVVVHAASPTVVKQYASLIMGLLLAPPWPNQFAVLPLTGVLPARDPTTSSELASFTVRVIVRTTPI